MSLWCWDFRPLGHRDLVKNILIWETVVVAAAWCMWEGQRGKLFRRVENYLVENALCVYVIACVCSMGGKTMRFWPSWKAESSRAKCPDSREVHRPSHAVSRNRIGCWDELLLPAWPCVSSLAACWSYLLDCGCVCLFLGPFPFSLKVSTRNQTFIVGNWIVNYLTGYI